jgi:hypothetical protein
MFQFRKRKTNPRDTKRRTLAGHVRKQGDEEDNWAQERGRKRRM